jgi:hypothetical protein
MRRGLEALSAIENQIIFFQQHLKQLMPTYNPQQKSTYNTAAIPLIKEKTL